MISGAAAPLFGTFATTEVIMAHKYQIWYMKPSWFINGNAFKEKPNPQDLGYTHIYLKDFEMENSNLEIIYAAMQGEVWSPNGEARDLIRSKGLQHTSMSIGDVIVNDLGTAYMVASEGFLLLT
jgi:hypothetical protein